MNEIPKYDELIQLLDSGGHISFVFDKKYKKRFKANVDRFSRLERIHRKTAISRTWYSIYGMYIGLLMLWGCRDSMGLENAIHVFIIASRHIKTIKGKDLDDGNVQATFVGQT